MRTFLKALGAVIAIMSAVPIFATWDVTTPAGSESKSLGDDRIREFKTDIQTALDHEGVFPGSDTSSPRFVHVPSTGTTADRPTGNDRPVGKTFVNTSSKSWEMWNGSDWQVLDVVSSNTITIDKMADESIGQAEIRDSAVGTGELVDLNVTLGKLGANSVDSSKIVDSTISANDLAPNLALPGSTVTIPSQTRFFAYNSSQDANETGDGTGITVDFDTEVYDTGGNFASDIFTAPITGYYHFSANVMLNDTSSAGNTCELRLVTTARIYTVQPGVGNTKESLFISTLADMAQGATAKIDLLCSGGSKVIDVQGNGGSSGATGMPTWFGGYLAN